MTSAAPLADLADFPDRLSPMVVKELRQGLRTRMFRAVLLVLHLLLILITLMSGAARNPDEVRWMLDGLSVLALCLVLPLCGFSAVAAEMKSKTLETLVLTRLSAIRIVVGKWASLASQSLLVAVSLVPYYIARYGLTGSDLPTELLMLVGEWLLGVVIAAAIVCLSTQKAFWLRALVVGFMLIVPSMMGMLALLVGTMAGGGGFGRFSTSSSGYSVGVTVLAAFAMAAWFIFYFLTLGATRIAPAASNLAAVKRVVHGSVIVLLVLAAWLTMSTEFCLQMAVVVAYLASVDAVIENRNEVPSPLIPFYRRGWMGRFLSWFLAPGWPSGVLFSLFIASVPVLAALVLLDSHRALHMLLDIAGVWLCAFVLHISGARHWRDLLAPYIGISVFIGLVGMMVALVSNVLVVTTGTTWLGMILPGTAAVTLETAKVSGKLAPGEQALLQMAGLGSGLVWAVVLLIMATLALRRLRYVRTEARLLAETAVS